jgi:hypothetical protein
MTCVYTLEVRLHDCVPEADCLHKLHAHLFSTVKKLSQNAFDKVSITQRVLRE